jgi:beta-barrel assembly-enhancing protease
VLACIAALAFGVARLAFKDRIGVPDVAIEVERGLRPIMRRQVAREGTVVEEPIVVDAFAAILARLGSGLGTLPLDPEVIIVDSPVVNAAALPGGIVCVYTGLIRTLETPEQMAAVLAHELAHVERRDAITGLAREIGMAAIASALSGGGETAAQSLLRSAIDLKYSRVAEDRADLRCLELLEKAGIDPGVFGDALGRIAEVGERTPDLLRWLDTHTDIDSRIARARSRSTSAEGPQRPLDVDWQAVRSALPSIFGG